MEKVVLCKGTDCFINGEFLWRFTNHNVAVQFALNVVCSLKALGDSVKLEEEF